ncbi:translational activator of cytochrome c oxidase 1 [Cimex lectularius]|uniref:Translational activator of cytochrome c oxidase 1 n=1 Tax=Cimex lectularius TaxID=79782 RepID=A0A8I6SG74_CIMLE|nr:translational activator of cytochrome c oxidase 1 [Cimex lectularius]
MLPSFFIVRQINCISRVQKRFAGHNKWSNIKHIKAEKDGQRSQLFFKLSQKIKVAIQEGGSANPDTNLQLAQAIENAKKNQMPIATIQSTINAFQMDKAKVTSFWFELKGPKGAFFVISTLTDNVKKTKYTIAPLLRKHGLTFAENSTKHLFDYKAVITAKPPPDVKDPAEETVDHAIECGAEEVLASEVEENLFDFICSMDQINHVKGKLLKMNYTVEKADFNLIPISRVALTDDEMETMSKLVDKLEALPEVIRIYDNIL